MIRWLIVILSFVAGRARAETLRATAFDLKTFFTVVSKAPVDVVAADVFEFLAHQRGDRSVIRISDRGSGLSARTIARRLSSVSGLYAYLVARGDTSVISKSGSAWLIDQTPRRLQAIPIGSTGAGAADVADDPVAVRGALAGVSAAHASRPGDDLGDVAWRSAPLRGPRVAVEGSVGR